MKFAHVYNEIQNEWTCKQAESQNTLCITYSLMLHNTPYMLLVFLTQCDLFFSNNYLRLIVVKTNRSTLHTVYNIQQSATHGSNDTAHRLSHRTAATTRFSMEGMGCQKQTAPRFLPTSDQLGLYLESIYQMAPPEHISD